MKRDIDLARIMLFAIEKDKRATGHGFICLNIDGYPKEEVSYHVNLLYEAGLIDAIDLSSLDNYRWEPRKLTWQGHEFLDLARNDNLWGKAKKELKKIENFSFQVLQNVLIRLATQQ